MNHHNVTLSADIARQLNLKTGEELPGIMPVLEIESFSNTVVQSKTTTGSQAIMTTPAGKDTYLETITISIIKDAACDLPTGNNFFITGVIQGVTQKLISLPILTLTAQQMAMSLTFRRPVKLDRNTAITISGASTTYTAGTCVRNCDISYTIQEVTSSQVA